jgi:CMP-N-acetylneuraminic acid synthetase
VPYFMNARDSLDIDHPEDLELADWFLTRRESCPV